MKGAVRWTIIFFRKVIAFYRVLKKIPEAKAIADLPCYYPGKPRKKRKYRIRDNIKWLLKYGEVNSFYTIYGLDLKNSVKPSAYMDYIHFMHQRNEKNHMGDVMSQLVLLRDKYMFYKYMSAVGLPVAEVFAVVKDGKIYDRNLDYVGENFLKDKCDYFVKAANGECANFVKHIKDFCEFLLIRDRIQTGDYIIQKRIVQSSTMNKLNDKSINTIRIITVYNNHNPYIFSSHLRVGTNTSGFVDNWAAGGIAVNIRDNGYLDDIGYYKPQYGGTTKYHPDSQIKLSEFKVPFYHEALKLTCEAHKHFYGVEYIGWDMAVSNEGLVFIEGNDNWEISVLQVLDGPLRENWEKMIKEGS